MPRVIAVLKLKFRIHDFVAYSKSVATCLGQNPELVPPYFPLAILEADIAELEDAVVYGLTRTRGSKTAWKARRAKVETDLATLKSYVQALADATTPQKAAILIAKAGMSVKKSSGHGKPVFEAKQDGVSGVVHLVARAERTRASYDWQFSIDGVHWESVETTMRADAVISGLTPGVVYFFRYRSRTKAGTGNWSQVVALLVK